VSHALCCGADRCHGQASLRRCMCMCCDTMVEYLARVCPCPMAQGGLSTQPATSRRGLTSHVSACSLRHALCNSIQSSISRKSGDSKLGILLLSVCHFQNTTNLLLPSSKKAVSLAASCFRKPCQAHCAFTTRGLAMTAVNPTPLDLHSAKLPRNKWPFEFYQVRNLPPGQCVYCP